MSHNFTPVEVERAKQMIGVTADHLLSAFRALTLRDCHEKMDIILRGARKAYRAWLPRLHPDHNPDDPIKHRQMLILSVAYAELKKLKDPDLQAQIWHRHQHLMRQEIQRKAQQSMTPFNSRPTFTQWGIQYNTTVSSGTTATITSSNVYSPFYVTVKYNP